MKSEPIEAEVGIGMIFLIKKKKGKRLTLMVEMLMVRKFNMNGNQKKKPKEIGLMLKLEKYNIVMIQKKMYQKRESQSKKRILLTSIVVMKNP